MSKSQRNKGHNWEREVAARFRRIFGDRVKRGWQTRQGNDAPDVDGTPFWVECKVGACPNIYAAMDQADAALSKAGDVRAPLAVIKRDRRFPLAVMYLGDFLDLVQEWKERGE